MTDDDHEQFRDQMNPQRQEICEAFADDLGGGPEDHFQCDE